MSHTTLPWSKSDSLSYRPELEGLRAVASLLVATFHIWLGRVSGGVDIFFIIAGFLTTATLLSHFSRHGRVRVGAFLLRIGGRLFPAAAVVLLAVAVATPILLITPQWKQVFTEIVASALFVENWQLIAAGADYLAQDNFHSPVQNFWAMSVQGQFYVLWAFVFVIVGLVCGALKSSRLRLPLAIAAVSVVILSSFAFALISVRDDQPAAYYNTFARAWEFGLGSLAAMILPRVTIPMMVRTVIGWIGILGVLTTGFIFDAGGQFPGEAALWPTVSALMVFAAGTGGRTRFGADRVLGSAPLVWIGGLSYGLYLWHWPILIFFTEVTGHRPGLPQGLAIILGAAALAWLTKRFVETPLLRSRDLVPTGRSARWRATAPVAMILIPLLAGTAVLGSLQTLTSRDLEQSRAAAAEGTPCFGGPALLSDECPTDWVSSSPAFDVGEDRSVIEESTCRTPTTGYEVRECSFGVIGADVRVVLIGNSHSASLFPAIEAMALENGWQLDVFYKSGCVFSAAPRKSDNAQLRESCGEWSKRVRDEIAARPPYLFAFNSYSALESVFVNGDGVASDSAGIKGFRKIWAPIIANGTTIVAFSDNPKLPSNEAIGCAYRPGSVETCGANEADVMRSDNLMIQAATGYKGSIPIDLTQFYCKDGRCPLVIGGVKVLRDRGHITATFARTLAPFIQSELDKANSVG